MAEVRKTRKARTTPEQVVKAAEAIERRFGRPATEAEVRRRLKGGSPNYVCKVLREWRSSKEAGKRPATGDGGGRMGNGADAGPGAAGSLAPRWPHSEHEGHLAPGHAGWGGPPDDLPGGLARTLEAFATEDRALRERVDRLQAMLSDQATDMKLLASAVQGLRLRLDSLSKLVSDRIETRAVPANAPDRTASVPFEPSSETAGVRKRVQSAIFHCVVELEKAGRPLGSNQLNLSLPEDLRFPTGLDLYPHLKIRAKKGDLIRYRGQKSGLFELGPGARALLDEHRREKVVDLTKIQSARGETAILFDSLIAFLEKAGRPRDVKDIVQAFSDGSTKENTKIKMLLRNSLYRGRTDDKGRGIGKVLDKYFVTRSDQTVNAVGETG